MEDEARQILELGDIYCALYSRCWETATDCYARQFPGKEQADRDLIVQMANFVFASCAEALSNEQFHPPENPAG